MSNEYSTVQYNTVRYSTLQYSTVQYSTVHYSTVQYSTVQYITVHYTTVQHSTAQHSTVQYDSSLCSIGITHVHRELIICIKPYTATFVLDRYSPLVYTYVCHIVGTVRLYKYCPAVCFPPPVVKCDTSPSSHRRQYTCQVRLFLTFPLLVQPWQADK